MAQVLSHSVKKTYWTDPVPLRINLNHRTYHATVDNVPNIVATGSLNHWTNLPTHLRTNVAKDGHTLDGNSTTTTQHWLTAVITKAPDDDSADIMQCLHDNASAYTLSHGKTFTNSTFPRILPGHKICHAKETDIPQHLCQRFFKFLNNPYSYTLD